MNVWLARMLHPTFGETVRQDMKKHDCYDAKIFGVVGCMTVAVERVVLVVGEGVIVVERVEIVGSAVEVVVGLVGHVVEVVTNI